VVRITDETFPIISFQSFGKSTEADIELLRPVYARAFRRGRPIICLSDARLATHSVDQRKLWADWLAETHRMDRDGCSVATVVLLDSPLLRSALIALNWITPAKVPQHVVGTMDEAMEECRKIAARHHMNVTAHVYGQIRLWVEMGRAQHATEAPLPLRKTRVSQYP
jgi:hypothetical protein